LLYEIDFAEQATDANRAASKRALNAAAALRLYRVRSAACLPACLPACRPSKRD
jgi:hypothetical protein